MTDAYHNLADGALLRERGLFVAEGRFVVRRVIEDARYRIHSLLLNEASKRDLSDAIDRLSPDVPVFVRPTDAFETITGIHFHRGCLALVHRPAPLDVEAVIGACASVVMLEDVTNADNVGGVFRNAAAFGAAGVILSPGCCDPLYRKAIRTSMGSVLRVPFARVGDWRGAIVRARERGFLVAALTPREPSEPVDLFAARVRGRAVAFVIGTEGGGVSDAVETLADARVRIPMAGGVDSLNLSVAAGIALYALKN